MRLGFHGVGPLPLLVLLTRILSQAVGLHVVGRLGGGPPLNATQGGYSPAQHEHRMFERTGAEVDRLRPITEPKEWMIVGGRLYIRRDSHAISRKAKGNDRALRSLITSVLENVAADFPDATFDVFPGSAGTNVTDSPVLAIARKIGGANTTHGGILVPNPYFLGLRNWTHRTKLYGTASRRAQWQDRKGHAFWRGYIDSQQPAAADGNRERVECVSLNKVHRMFDMHANLAKITPPQQYCHNKYLLNLPGSKHGSYSRNLNHLWTSGSVVMMWESTPGQGLNYEEWYYPALEKNVTHLVVNKDNLVQVVNDLRGNDLEAQRLGANGPLVHDAFLCPCCIADQFLRVFRLLQAKMAFDPRAALAANASNWVPQAAKDYEQKRLRDEYVCDRRSGPAQ